MNHYDVSALLRTRIRRQYLFPFLVFLFCCATWLTIRNAVVTTSILAYYLEELEENLITPLSISAGSAEVRRGPHDDSAGTSNAENSHKSLKNLSPIYSRLPLMDNVLVVRDFEERNFHKDMTTLVYGHNHTNVSLFRKGGVPVLANGIRKRDVVEIVGDVDSVFDFAVAGFPKCGTTTMINTLAQVAQTPLGDLCMKNVGNLVRSVYTEWNTTVGGVNKTLRGFKCPKLLENLGLRYDSYFPSLKLIIGLRHPVHFVQSFINMNIGQLRTTREKVFQILRKCDNFPNFKSKCYSVLNFGNAEIKRSQFHIALASLGRTQLTSEEMSLLVGDDKFSLSLFMKLKKGCQYRGCKQPLFLYEFNEVVAASSRNGSTATDMDTDDHAHDLWTNLESFLGLSQPIPRQVNKNTHDGIAKKHGYNRTAIQQIEQTYIDICEPKLTNLRIYLMKQAWRSSQWICKYLLATGGNRMDTNVYVTDKDYFCGLLNEWEKDPCGQLAHVGNGVYQ